VYSSSLGMRLSSGFSQGFDFLVLTKPEELAWFYRTTNDPTGPEPFPGRPAPVVIGDQLGLLVQEGR